MTQPEIKAGQVWVADGYTMKLLFERDGWFEYRVTSLTSVREGEMTARYVRVWVANNQAVLANAEAGS